MRRLRLIYFGLAAIWGYLAGTAAILGGLAALGKPLRLATETALLLLGAGLVAVIGGVVAAVAYRDASNRYGG